MEESVKLNNNCNTIENSGKSKSVIEYTFMEMAVLIVAISFLGFIVENASMLITVGVIDSRWQRLPFLCVYGIAIASMYSVMGTPSRFRWGSNRFEIFESGQNKRLSRLVYFLTVSLTITFGEIFFGYFWEMITGTYLWDYTHLPLHITRYTSIPTTLLFSLAITLFMDLIFNKFMQVIRKALRNKAFRIVFYVIGTLFVCDSIVTYILMFSGNAIMIWQIKVF